MIDTGLIILAAGSSSRLGRPKQLLPYQGQTLLHHITDEAIRANLNPILLITGAHADQVKAAVTQSDVEILFNHYWEEGMASGIVLGISKLLRDSTVKSVILAVCDQPFVTAELLLSLMELKRDSGRGIVACSYSNTVGTPVLFDHKYFDALMQLKGDEGAKKLLKYYKDDVTTLPFPEGDIDIDTEEDYRSLNNMP